MKYIVVCEKVVPNVANIPPNGWKENPKTGEYTLDRSVLDNEPDPLARQAFYAALNVRDRLNKDIKIITITMGPPMAEEILRDSIAVGADEAVLLTSKNFAGADTRATAYALAQGIRKTEEVLMDGAGEYMIFAGKEAVDGDTAQVPIQIAKELGVECIAYAGGYSVNGNSLLFHRMTEYGRETVSPLKTPCLVTFISHTHARFRNFARTRWSQREKEIYVWGPDEIGAKAERIGGRGSRTQVYNIFTPPKKETANCIFPKSIESAVDLIEQAYSGKIKLSKAEEEKGELQKYTLNGRESEYRGDVWIYAEQYNGKLHPVSFELLTKARELADTLGVKTGAVLTGKNIDPLAKDLIDRRADKVYLAAHDLLDEFHPTHYTNAVVQTIDKYGPPQILLVGATPLGRELAPAVSYIKDAGLTADCTHLYIEDYKNRKGEVKKTGILVQRRTALGGNIMADIMTKDSVMQMATVRPGVIKACSPHLDWKGEVEKFSPKLLPDDTKIKVLSREHFTNTGGIEQAKIVVAGGMGLKNSNNFTNLLADLSEAVSNRFQEKVEVGASRRAIEFKLVSTTCQQDRGCQIGQSGKSIRPKLYIAIGISGAVQHTEGVKNSEIIVAINNKEEAPIFQFADIGLVGRAEEIIPQMVKCLNNGMGG